VLVHEFIDDSREAQEVIESAHVLVKDAYEDRTECDRLLARHARHWDLNRLALVDRNILRLAAHELRLAKAPPKVVITEAIRLAREFSTAESPRFVNGVLDAIAKELKAGEEKEKISRDAGDAQDEEGGEEEEKRRRISRDAGDAQDEKGGEEEEKRRRISRDAGDAQDGDFGFEGEEMKGNDDGDRGA
jgi:transcription antitermination protein NusB